MDNTTRKGMDNMARRGMDNTARRGMDNTARRGMDITARRGMDNTTWLIKTLITRLKCLLEGLHETDKAACSYR
jgi:hypothetical protein